MEPDQSNKVVIFWGDKEAAIEDEQVSLFWDLFTIVCLLPDDLLERIVSETFKVNIDEDLPEKKEEELEKHVEEHMFVELYANPRRISLHYNDIKLVEVFLDDNSYTQYFGEHNPEFDITNCFEKIHRGYEAFSRGLAHGS